MFLALVVSALMAAEKAADTDDSVLRRVSDVAAAVHNLQLGATFEIDAIATSPIQDGTNLAFVASDDSGSVLMYQEPAIALKAIRPGARIKASGIIKQYDAATAAALALTMSITGESQVAPPPEAKLSDIVGGKYDMRYVKASGTVKAMFHDTIDKHFSFAVIVGDNSSLHIAMHTPNGKESEMLSMIGAEVSVRGIVQNAPHGHRRHFRPLLSANRLDDFTIIRPFDSSDDSIPVLGDMKDVRPDLISSLGPHKETGTVMAVWKKGTRFLMKNDAGKFSKVTLLEGVKPPAYAERVMAVGFPETDLFNINMSNARWQLVKSEASHGATEAPTNVTVRTLLPKAGKLDIIASANFGKVVSLEGVVRSLPAPENANERMLLESEGLIMPIDASSCPGAFSGLSIGCRVRVAGVFIFEADSWRTNAIFPNINDVSIVMRSPADIVVLSRPPWWTPGRLLAVIGVLIFVVAAVLYKARMAKKVADLRFSERTRLASELHDYIAQDITAISYQVTAAKLLHGQDESACTEHLDTAERMLGSCRTELRRCLWDLRNEALDECDVAKAVKTSISPLTRNVATEIDMDIPRGKLDDSSMHAMLSIIRELTANAVTHGHAKTISIRGSTVGETLVITVSDDGVGFDVATRPRTADGHFGLAGAEERALQHGGGLSVESSPGGGTRATITLASAGQVSKPSKTKNTQAQEKT